MSVTVALPINKPNVYHTTNCKNCQEIANPREIPKAKAKRIGLTECVHCAKEYNRQHEQETKHYRALRDADTITELKAEVQERFNADD